MKTTLYLAVAATLLISACSEQRIVEPSPHERPPVDIAVAPLPQDAVEGLSQDVVETRKSAVAYPESEASLPATAKQQAAPPPSPAVAAAPYYEDRMMVKQRHTDFYYAPPLPHNTERYQTINDNPIKLVSESPVSTFSIDVDTGSYSNVRRMLNQGQLPPTDAVRVEEMINYFPYDYALPKNNSPFAVHTALAYTPWNPENILMRIAIKGQDMAKHEMPPANLVFLIDTSGSMSSSDKLPLLCASMKALTQQLRAQDTITIVTYSGSTSVALPPTSGREKATINRVIDSLRASGSTAGGAGIELAYQAAQQSFVKGGINRILLATDGDFNVGVTDFDQLKKMVEEKRKSGIALSTLGFGSGNYNEQLMEQLADAGNGAYSYIDTLMEGHKVLVHEMTSTLATIAKDVKIQVEFNPAAVKEYRLIGYENRLLNREDFNNDKVDAGDIGAGHTVTALYEITLVGKKGAVDSLRYQTQSNQASQIKRDVVASDELAYIKLRYKQPDGEQKWPQEVGQ